MQEQAHSWRNVILDLDEFWGKPRDPDGINAWERNPDGTPLINRTLQSGWRLKLDPGKRYLFGVNEKGDLLLAEELVVNGGRKLGHPTLTGGGKLRIAGEAFFRRGDNKWVFTDQSGRYHNMDPATPAQLQSVADRIKLQADLKNEVIVEPF